MSNKPFEVQLFRDKSAWTDSSCKVDFDEIISFYKGDNNGLLKKINYDKFDDWLIYRSGKSIGNDITDLNKNTHLIFPFLKGRKRIEKYVLDAVWNLPKNKLVLGDFNNIKYDKFETIISSFNKGLYDLIKTLLPCYTTCYFKINSSKTKENVVAHSGYIRFDIDNILTDEDVDVLKSMKPYAIVPSTSGIPSPIFKIDIGPDILKKFNINDLHTYYYKWFEKELDSKGIKADPSCININRLFYVSVNRDFKYYYIDKEAKEYTLDDIQIDTLKDVVKNARVKRDDYINNLPNDLDVERVRELIFKEVDEIYKLCSSNNIQPFYDGNMRNNLRNFYFSLNNYINEDEMESILCRFLLLTELDDRITDTKYRERDINYLRKDVFTDRKSTDTLDSWKHIYRLGKVAKELIAAKKEKTDRAEYMLKIKEHIAGFPQDYPKILLNNINSNTSLESIKNLYHFLTLAPHKEGFYLNNILDVKNFHKDFLNVEKNIITDMYLINGKQFNSIEVERQAINDALKNQITRVKSGVKKTITFSFKDYFETLGITNINPIEDYFKSLGIDDNTDMIDKVITIFDECSENNAGKIFADWCYGLVKNAIDPNYYDRILYLYAPNGGEGKTWFIQNDLIPALSDYISSDFNFNTESKDDKFKLTENIILLDDEGGKTSKKQDETKKSVSSKKTIKERVSFDKTKSSKKRIASIVVATNTPEISSASNKDRRSLVVSLKSVKYKDPTSFIMRWRNEVEVDKLWRQLYSLYLRDKNYQFVEDDYILQESMNWSQESIATILVDTHLRIPKKGERYAIIGHVQLRDLLERIYGKKIDMSLLGILKKKGFIQVNKIEKCPLTKEWKTGFKVVFKTIETHNDFMNTKGMLVNNNSNFLGEFEDIEVDNTKLLKAVEKIIK